MEKYLNKIKNAKNKDDLHQINYDVLLDHSMTGAQWDLVSGLCVWKETQLAGKSQTELDHCASVLKLAKKYINKIK